MAKSVVLVSPLFAWIEKSANGVVEPNPAFCVLRMVNFEVFITITTPGTASGAMYVSLPTSTESNGMGSVIGTFTGKGLAGGNVTTPSGNTVSVLAYDNTTVCGTASGTVAGWYYSAT